MLLSAAVLAILTGCAAVPAKVGTGPIEVSVTPGKAWLHRHPLFLGLTFQTPPQYAIWIEDENGTYLSTIFVTHKTATQGWVASPGEKVPREESGALNLFPSGAITEESNPRTGSSCRQKPTPRRTR